jgi:hypothetical protein
MSKEIEEEDLLSCSEFHFARYVSIIGVGPEDVERDAAQDGKIMCPVILARSGIIFVEDHVEPPVRLVFYAPRACASRSIGAATSTCAPRAIDREGIRLRRHAARPSAGRMGDPRKPPDRARDRQSSSWLRPTRRGERSKNERSTRATKLKH